MGDAGTKIPNSCVPTQRCGTHAPGWMQGEHPKKEDGVVSRKVCFHWSGNCCRWSVMIQVRNCGGHYVYKLEKPPACFLRFCGDKGHSKYCLFVGINVNISSSSSSSSSSSLYRHHHHYRSHYHFHGSAATPAPSLSSSSSSSLSSYMIISFSSPPQNTIIVAEIISITMNPYPNN